MPKKPKAMPMGMAKGGMAKPKAKGMAKGGMAKPKGMNMGGMAKKGKY
jgi:hypothetical protein